MGTRILLFFIVAVGLMAQGPKLFQQGIQLHGEGKFGEAIASFEQAQKAGYIPQACFYRIGKAYAKMNDMERSLSYLGKAADAGFLRYDLLRDDADLEAVRKDSRFVPIYEKVQSSALPCQFHKEYQQFDFWLGEWNAMAGTALGGTSKIEKSDGGCIINETWIGAGGGTGRSINAYHAGKKKWEQRWVDSSGRVTDYIGEFRDGSMRFDGTTIAPNGGVKMVKMTFTPINGKVRQYGETTSDGGKTWTISFDFMYERK